MSKKKTLTHKEKLTLLLQTLLLLRQNKKLKNETLLITKPEHRIIPLTAYIDEVFEKLGYSVVFTDVMGTRKAEKGKQK